MRNSFLHKIKLSKYEKIPIVLLLAIIILFLTISNRISAQTRDTIIVKMANDTVSGKNHSPARAWIFSAIIPGGGQIYNKKYWKVPLLYGLIGTLVFVTDYNSQFYNEFSRNYAYSQMQGPVVYYDGDFSSEQLLLYKKKFKRSRDLNYIMFAGLYLVNIIDAVVDANMFDYDVSKDLSLRIDPIIEQNVYLPEYQLSTMGLRLSITF